jgi:pyrimidine-nucleoside phosphorylase
MVSSLGAGRATKEDTIDFGAGIVMAKKTGDAVQVGDILATLYANDEFLFERAADVYVQALTIGADPVELQNPILGMVE